MRAAAKTRMFPAQQVEILVVDDGSTDDTERRLERFHDAIRYLKKPNGGQASAFNFGVPYARGEFIALLDADDVWLPNKLSRIQEAFLRQKDAGMAYHRIYEWTADGGLSTRGHFIAVSGRVTASRYSLLCYPMMQTSSLVFRQRAIKDLLPVPETLRTQADAYLTALIIFICPVVVVDEYLAKYRIHEANLFHSDAARPTKEKLENRVAMRGALLAGIENWLHKHEINMDTPNMRDYLKQWKKMQEADGFALQAPDRRSYFLHLVEFPMVYRELMSGRQLAYSYLRAFTALALGYRHLHFFDDAHARWKAMRSGDKRPLATDG
jgi:glycosyltransferase involved in cell wall biosynthesis